MKVKKVLSLALAVVMIFTMIPAQLILSNAGYTAESVGEQVKYNTVLTKATEAGYADKNCIKVVFQAAVDYTGMTTDTQKAIVTLAQVLKIDTSVLEPVSMAKSSKGESRLQMVKDNASSAPSYAWNKNAAKNNLAMEANSFSAYDADEEDFVDKSYGITSASVSYNNATGIMYAKMECFDMNGLIWEHENVMTPIMTMYLKVVDGKTWDEVRNAISIVPQSELLSTDGTGCQAPSIKKAAYASSGSEGVSDVTDVVLDDQLPTDPVQPTTVKVTFNWKTGEEGSEIDKTTGEVDYEPGADLTVPANSEADYSTNEYDYEFTGWSPEVPATVPETPATQTYTAQYQKKAVNTDALAAAYNEDKGLVQEDYDELVPGAWNALQDALANAKTVLEKDEPNKVEVADALAAIESAMQNLTPKQPQGDYTITFNWQKGAKTEDVTTAPNAQPQLPNGAEDDYFSADHKTKYIFTGWKAETGVVYGDASRLPEATADATYTAQYREEAVTVKVKFVVNDQTVSEIDKPYGDMVTLADAPTVQSYDEGDTHYEFTGWAPAFAEATEPATYTAQFKRSELKAEYDRVDAAIAAAEARQAEDEFADKYKPETIQALTDAINEVVRNLPKSDQARVDAMADRIEAAIDALDLKEITLTFYTHDAPSGIEQPYRYGDVVTAPQVAPYTDDQGFTWTFDGWNKDVPETAKANDQFEATYKKGDAASTADLQEAVAAAINKRDNGTDWKDDGVAALNAVLEEAAPYLEQGAQFPASQQDAIDALTNRVNAAASALTPKDAQEFDVTFNWKGDNETPQTKTTQWADGATPQVPAEFKNTYETQDYTYTFVRWEPSIVAVDGANQVYNAIYDDGTPKRAITTALEQAIADAQAKQAEDNYADKYTENSRNALQGALTTAQDLLATNPLPSQQNNVNTATQNLINALNMAKNQFTITFYSHDYEQGDPQIKEYGDEIVAPSYGPYSEGDYDYTPNGWADQDGTPVEVPATATQNGKFYANYTKVGPIGANYDDNTAAVTAANNVVNNPDADKIYTDDYVNGVQDALNQNVDQGLGRSRQDEVNQATQRINDALANPQYKTYTIRFLNEDGSVIATDSTYKYNDDVTLPANPTKAPTVDKTFTFKEWTPAVAKVTGDQDYTATFNEATRQYTVTYKYHGGQATEAVNYGALPQTPPEVPTYIENGIKYTFDHWTPEFGPVEGPQEYTAEYSQEQMPNVTVTFRYATSVADVKDGKLTDVQQSVVYGEMPVEPDVKSFTDGDTTYRFDGWDKTVVAATADAVYTAIYTPVTDFTPDMSEINALVARYNQMVKTGKYNKDDLKLVKAYIDEIYDTTFTSQDEVNDMAAHLKALEDGCRRIDATKKSSKEETQKRKESYSRRYSRTARTGDTATLIVMSVILVSSLGIAFISLKKRRENI